MNTRIISNSFIAALVYEVIIKLLIQIWPSFFHGSFWPGITSFLSLVVAVIFVLYGYSLYREFYEAPGVRRIIEWAVGFLAVSALLRVPFLREFLPRDLVFMLNHVLQFLLAVLITTLFFTLDQTREFRNRALNLSLQFCGSIFAFHGFLALVKVIQYSRHLAGQTPAEPSAAFLWIVVIIFSLSRISLLVFAINFQRERELRSRH